MSGPVAARSAPLRVAQPLDELAVFVGCHAVVCTLPVRVVDRLLVRDEVELLPPPRRLPPPPPANLSGVPSARPAAAPPTRLPQVVRAAGEPFAAWNLGTLLGLPPVSAAWVLLRIGDGPEPVAIALRTGPCLMVQAPPRSAIFPPGIFRERGPGIVGSFSTASLPHERIRVPLGICLDPLALWSPAELEASRAAIATAESEPD